MLIVLQTKQINSCFIEMKNVTSLKASKIESPKTPGGISKSLLTPCRRVGLSRNWKKAGPSPFVSPLTTSNATTTEPKIEKKETRKRKVRTPTEELEEAVAESPHTPVVVGLAEDDDAVEIFSSKTEKIINTPSRPVETPRRKKSKTVLPGLSKAKSIATSKNTKIVADENVLVQNEDLPPTPTSNESECNLNSQENCKTVNNTPDIQENPTENMAVEVATPISTKSASKLRRMKSNHKVIDAIKTDLEENSKTVAKNQNVKENHEIPNKVSEKIQYKVKQRSPNDLTKECVVVIQKKMFKIDKIKKSDTNTQNKENSSKTVKNTVSQTLFHSESDSDEVPLCQLNNKLHKKEPEIITIEDDDFETKTTEPVKKLDKNTSTGGLKPKTKPKTKIIKHKKSVESKLVEANFSNSFDDDEDFDFDNKKTILIRKTYDKTSKPLKAKSTGSITQRDIDELRARIEHKKKMLMAKAMTEDTEELRTLIKKWQKGCQDALMELMELMKTKFPDKDNMDYAEMLQTLKIPALLVGYDEDNDCFNTPSDDNVMLTTFKDV